MTDEQLIRDLAEALEAEQLRAFRLVDSWHERMGSDCWVRPDWTAIARFAVVHLRLEPSGQPKPPESVVPDA